MLVSAMNASPTDRRLIEARRRLALASEHVNALQWQAICGVYDAAVFDAAVLALNRAIVDVRAAMTELRGGPGACLHSASELSSQTTPRMQFARWLVTTGRLHESVDMTESD
jgi:hypothetical protein